MASTISNNHYASNPLDRCPTTKKLGKRLVYEQTEQTIEEVAVDIINGIPKADILQKLKEGMYSTEKKFKQSMAYELYNAGVARISLNRTDRIEEARDIIWSRLENVYKESMEAGMLQNARQCLVDMCKLFGLSKESPNTAIQINQSDDGKLTVNFGFMNNNNDGTTV